MISIPEIAISRLAVVRMNARSDFANSAIEAAKAVEARECAGVIAATFSNRERFPALSIRVATALNLPLATPAFDLQLACSAYPYALYLASKMAADLKRPILVINGDQQTPLVDAADAATNRIFSDAVTASVITVDESRKSNFDFLSRADDALSCRSEGPIRMDGFKVFSFVATEISRFLRSFGTTDFDFFAPHQAHPYMVRQLAKTLNLEDKLLAIEADDLNPGSCSVAMALAKIPRGDTRALIAGFGAGYSACAGVVRLAKDFCCVQPERIET